MVHVIPTLNVPQNRTTEHLNDIQLYCKKLFNLISKEGAPLFFLQKHFSMINSSTLQIQAKHLVFSYLPNLIVLLSGNDLK